MLDNECHDASNLVMFAGICHMKVHTITCMLLCTSSWYNGCPLITDQQVAAFTYTGFNSEAFGEAAVGKRFMGLRLFTQVIFCDSSGINISEIFYAC